MVMEKPVKASRSCNIIRAIEDHVQALKVGDKCCH